MRSPRARCADEAGVAGWEALVLGVLVFVFGTLAVANVWAVIDARLAASAAAREAARAFALADAGADAEQAAWMAAEASLEAHGWPRSATEAVEIDGVHERCARVEATVTLVVEPILLPAAGLGEPVAARATHRERVDPLRGGLAGDVVPVPGATLCAE